MKSFHDSRGALLGTMFVWVLSLCLLVSIPVRAQVVGATLSGAVTDNSGASVPNAQVSIKNSATGVIRNTTTDTAGFYQAPNLDSGTYEVNVTAPGFKTSVQSGLILTVGGTQQLNFKMEVGEVTQTVSVTAEAPVVQLTSSSLGNLVNSTTVVELPLNGRDWGSLASLSPGVAAVQVQQTTSATVPKGNRGYGNQMTIAGTRPQQNNYRLDGISIIDYAGGTPASVIALTLGVDAIAEFSVITSNYSAEYGRTSGGVINAITKGGTSQYHGDAYWFLRDGKIDARGAIDAPGQPLPPFHRNQFGGSVGGHIPKLSKTFFFVNFEGFRQTKGNSILVTSLSQNARNGIVSAATAGPAGPLSSGSTAPLASCPAGYTLPKPLQSNICISTPVIPFFNWYPVLPASVVSDTGTITNVVPTTASENYETGRIDHTFSDKDSLNGSFFIDRATFAQPDSLLNVLNGNTSGRTMATVSETHIFSPSLINSLRVGWSRINMVQNNPIRALSSLGSDTSGIYSTVPGRPGPAIQGTGLTNVTGGLGELTQNGQIWNAYQLYDDAFWTKGTHSMKFGFVVENDRHSPSNVQLRNGSWFFGGLLGFLQNQPTSFRMPAASYAYPQVRQTIFGFYYQDDWKIRPNLTLNLGLRYEAATVMSELHGNIQNLACITCTTPIIGNPLYHNPTLHNFEPRVGFAWDPFRDGKSSVRGAFGMFDVLPTISELFTAAASSAPQSPPLLILAGSSSLPQGTFPKNGGVCCGPNVPNTSIIDFTEPNPKRNYVMVWNFDIQRQITADTSVTIGYVGNRGVHMQERFGTVSMNKPMGFTPQGLPYWNPVIGTYNPFNSAIKSEIGSMWGGDAHYNALQASVNKKFSHGFQAQLAFTLGRGTDTSSASTISDPYVNSISTMWWFCKVCRFGRSDFDITKKLVANFVWNLPSPKIGGAFGSHLLGGWELGSIIIATSGTPFTPLINGDPQGTASTDSPNLVVPDLLPGCNTVLPNYRATGQYINTSCFSLPKATPAMAVPCTTFGFVAANPSGTPPVVGNPGIAGTCANLQGNAGRNSLVGPGFFDMDFSIIKNTHVTERFNVQFRAEFFNALNHASWQAPINNSYLFNANGSAVSNAGVLDAVTMTGREIQFGLKLIF